MSQNRKMFSNKTKCVSEKPTPVAMKITDWIEDFKRQGNLSILSDPARLEELLSQYGHKFTNELGDEYYTESIFRDKVLNPAFEKYQQSEDEDEAEDFNKPGLYLYRIDENGARYITPFADFEDRNSALNAIEEMMRIFTNIPDLVEFDESLENDEE